LSNPQSVIEQMSAAGIIGLLESDLIVDGQLHRFQPDDSKNKTAWYTLFYFVTDSGEPVVTGAYGDWRFGDKHTVKLNGLKISNDDREKLKRQAAEKKRQSEIERKDRARRAALRAQAFWPQLKTTGDSPYLKRKQVKAYGVRFSERNAMAIPMRDMPGTVYGLQVIHAEPRVTKDGSKIEKDFFPYGANPKGHFHLIGNEPNPDARVVICEGYATGASIHEATGYTVYVAFNVGNLMLIAQNVRDTYPNIEIVIAADDDYLTFKPVRNPGVTEAKKVIRKVKGLLAVPRFSNRTGEKWTDFNDLHIQEGLNVVRQQIVELFNNEEKIPFDDAGWKGRLSRTDNGNIRSEINNVKLVLMNDERWKGVLQCNEFDYDIHKLKIPPFEDNPKLGDWDEVDTERLRCWLAANYGFTPSEKDAIAAIRVAAENSAIHPIKDYLENIVWDGKHRLDAWLVDYLGAEDNEYTIKVGSKFLIGAVARVYAVKGKGVKMDNVLILEGLQGEGKSTTIESICGEGWFSETPFELGSKEGYQQLRGVWFQELAELDSFNKAESTKAKAFFSAKEDYYRPSYGRKASKFPRQCVFVGSTNQDQYLKDVTGNRRYWPIKCYTLNIPGLREVRDQLWAEAFSRYKNKEPWWVLNKEKPLFEEQQDERFSEDVWESKIRNYLYDAEQQHENYFTMHMLMENGLKFTDQQMKPPEQTRVGFIMSRIGWRKIRKRLKDNHNKPTWVYERPEDERVIVKKPKDDDLPL